MPETTTVETNNTETPVAKAPRRTGGALGGKVIAELQEIASGLGLSGTEKMRKNQLIDAIKQARGETPPAAAPKAAPVAKDAGAKESKPAAKAAKSDSAKTDSAKTDSTKTDAGSQDDAKQGDKPARGNQGGRNRNQGGQGQSNQDKNDAQGDAKNADQKSDNKGSSDGEQRQERGQGGQGGQGGNQGNQRNRNQGDRNQGGNQGNRNQGGNQGNRNQGGNQGNDDDEFGGNARRRNRRGRNRGQDRGMDVEPTINEDDVLVPAVGIFVLLAINIENNGLGLPPFVEACVDTKERAAIQMGVNHRVRDRFRLCTGVVCGAATVQIAFTVIRRAEVGQEFF